ncbi:RICIN domain-containing protein [Massilia antarctica]|uniref:RICIN domain-containing protein n=1 Tax=Massilia antarctica TaxID=2765360 RepID=UPI002276DB85|nr:hypothetical protein [Massilia sp. H27-R4]
MPMVSFTLPVDPARLPGSALDSGKNMGDPAISAANSTYKQIKGVFTGRTDAQLWTMIGMTPMIGVNDVATDVFRQADARNVGDFAKQKKLGLLSFWNLQRDRYMGSAYYGLLNVNSGTAVDVQASSLNDGANIHQWTNSTRHLDAMRRASLGTAASADTQGAIVAANARIDAVSRDSIIETLSISNWQAGTGIHCPEFGSLRQTATLRANPGRAR